MVIGKQQKSDRLITLDDPHTTDFIHRNKISQKSFLRKLYREIYQTFKNKIPNLNPNSKVIEIGSGGGFLKEIIPSAITTEYLSISNIDLQISATALPFKSKSVDAFLLLDTFHHIPNVSEFLSEAGRCLKQGGKLIMMEPANTLWGRFIYRNFHHEPFIPESEWEFNSTGPLSSANGALPWIVFVRDLIRFTTSYNNLKLLSIRAHTPIRYLLSGGFSKPQMVPGFLFSTITFLENLISPLFPFLGMFYWIEIEKTKDLNL